MEEISKKIEWGGQKWELYKDDLTPLPNNDLCYYSHYEIKKNGDFLYISLKRDPIVIKVKNTEGKENDIISYISCGKLESSQYFPSKGIYECDVMLPEGDNLISEFTLKTLRGDELTIFKSDSGKEYYKGKKDSFLSSFSSNETVNIKSSYIVEGDKRIEKESNNVSIKKFITPVEKKFNKFTCKISKKKIAIYINDNLVWKISDSSILNKFKEGFVKAVFSVTPSKDYNILATRNKKPYRSSMILNNFSYKPL